MTVAAGIDATVEQPAVLRYPWPAPSPVTPADRLTFTLVLAVIIHVLLVFGVHLVPPTTRAAPMLEVTLVPAQSPDAPKRADFLAQANQQGSGQQADARLLTTTQRAPQPGRADVARTAPTPTPPQPVAPVPPQITSVSAARQVASVKKAPAPPAPPTPAQRAQQLQAEEIAALEARLSAQRQAYARRPRVRTLDSVSARQDDFAPYIEHFRERVEAIGNARYPSVARLNRLQGSVRLLVALQPDGRVLRVEVLRSSGHRVLDAAAIQSVRDAQPFTPFPAGIRAQVDILQVVRTWRFAEGLKNTSY